MIKPINGHLVIEPVKQEGFIQQMTQTYQEIGVVMEVPNDFPETHPIKVGAKVYFDAWLAKKYPREGAPNDFIWMVRYDDIVAYEE